MTPRHATPSGPDLASTVELGAPEDWSNLPTKADVKSSGRRAAQAQQAAAVAHGRLIFDVPATMSDATVWALLMIEAIGRPSGR